jgi:hypothetical protein
LAAARRHPESLKMNTNRPIVPLKFPGVVVASAATPTLADVMTRLSQVQQNQSQIWKGVQSMLVNQILLAELLAGLFVATTPPTAAAYQNVRSLCQTAVQDIERIANKAI